MKFKEAVFKCAVRSAIYRKNNPTKKYYKNHPIELENRIPKKEQQFCDWEEYDPQNNDNCSLFMFND